MTFSPNVAPLSLESPLDSKEIKPAHLKSTQKIHWKDWCWNSNTLTTWCEELTHWKRPWCRKRLRVGEEGHDRRWDGWIASPTQWTWVWVNSRSWWWSGRPGVLQFMGLQRIGHDWMTSLSLFTFMHWRRKWQPTPVFLPGESQGQGSLVGCQLWGCIESDTTDVT